jgi:hypothetical protein
LRILNACCLEAKSLKRSSSDCNRRANKSPANKWQGLGCGFADQETPHEKTHCFRLLNRGNGD